MVDEDIDPIVERFFESIRSWHDDWIRRTKGDPKLVADYKNCTHQPVWSGNGKVFDIFSVNTLHLLIGNVNRGVTLFFLTYDILL